MSNVHTHAQKVADSTNVRTILWVVVISSLLQAATFGALLALAVKVSEADHSTPSTPSRGSAFDAP